MRWTVWVVVGGMLLAVAGLSGAVLAAAASVGFGAACGAVSWRVVRSRRRPAAVGS